MFSEFARCGLSIPPRVGLGGGLRVSNLPIECVRKMIRNDGLGVTFNSKDNGPKFFLCDLCDQRIIFNFNHQIGTLKILEHILQYWTKSEAHLA